MWVERKKKMTCLIILKRENHRRLALKDCFPLICAALVLLQCFAADFHIGGTPTPK